MSKALNVHERAYCVTRKELYAVVVALKKFHTYLYGQKVILRTDNSAVSWMQKLKLPTGQMARWIQELSLYDLTVVHRKGKTHANADALSRRPCKVCKRYAEDPNSIEEIEELEQCETSIRREPANIAVRTITNIQATIKKIPVLLDGWDGGTIRREQMVDDDIGPIFTLIDQQQSRPQWKDLCDTSPQTKILWSQWDRLVIYSGMLYRKYQINDKESLQLIIPTKYRTEVMSLNHDIPTAAHLGWKAGLSRISQDFYWPGVKADVQKYCQACDSCCARKPTRSSNRAPLGRTIVGGPMEKIAMDILGPFPRSDQNNKYVLVMCDEFTKWTEAFPLPNQEAQTIATVFVNEFICRFGTPLQIHTDQGRNFESRIFKEMCELFRIHKTRTTSFRPQANGTVERFNRTLANMLAVYCHNNQQSWDKYLPQVMMAYRATIHSTTKVTPNRMVFGHNIVMPSQAIIGRPQSNDNTEIGSERYISNLQETLVVVHDFARKNLKKQAIYRKRYYDIKAKTRALQNGQAVWLHDPTIKPGVCHKLSNRWRGPYLVYKRLDDLTYLIRTSASGSKKVVHIDRLLPYKGIHLPRWMKPLDLKQQVYANE